ncbi:MAG: hypothetical protein LBF37_02305 [Rickettsiales bacterium]|jgi:hypothetical protein|nr:hypothetical protein [Rickettsiales bacterium]
MNNKHFSSENLLLSAVGHLALVAVMVTSFAIVVERAKLVTPDRIEITEIDLSQVKITRDETSLYNTAIPTVKEPEKPVPQEKPKAEPEAEPQGEDKPIETPSLVDNEKPKKQEDKKVEETPAPKKRTVVRINRETVSLNRTMTVSVVDALRVALTRCWVVDTNRTDIADIRAVAHLTMYKNGMVRDMWFESAARADHDPAFAYVLDTIRGALKTCQPFSMLPASEFDHWEKIQLTFYPTQGKIM